MHNQDLNNRHANDPESRGEPSSHDPQEDSLPTAESPTQESPAETKKKKRWGRRISLAILIFVVVVILGGAVGYGFAIRERIQEEESVKGTAVYDQFLLGILNMERGEYEIARQRFEYVLQLDPSHTGAAEMLTEALLHLGESASIPTPRPSATPAPTADTRGQEEIFANALAFRDMQDWDSLLAALDSLRASDPNYNAVEVDGLYYLAYRNRGIHRIQVEGNLEGGIFDITRAEAFGPLDVEARNYRKWAEDYLTGISFWGLDWNQVLVYFDNLAISAPYLSDSSYLTSLDRQATARVELYSQYLVTAGYRMTQGKYCEAYDLYSEASVYILLDEAAQQNFELARNQCLGIEPTQAPEETTQP
jgi:hypothetical protein